MKSHTYVTRSVQARGKGRRWRTTGLLLLALLMLLTTSAPLSAGLAGTGTLPEPALHRTAAHELSPTMVGQSVQPLSALAPDPTAITARANDQVRPAIAHSRQADEYLVVWEDGSGGGGSDIYGRRVGADGVARGDEFAIALEGDNLRLAPDVAYNQTDGEFLVVWEWESTPDNHDIYARRVGSDGSLISSEIPIATLTNFESNPAVAYNTADNEYLVVWEHRYASGDHDIYGQRLDSDGTQVGGSIVIDGASYEQLAPAIAYGAVDGQYLVAWQDDEAGAGDYNIRARRLGNGGSLMGSEIAISTWEYDQVKPRLAFNSAANAFLVVWEDHHWGWGGDWDIFGQRVNADGTLAGGNFAISWEGAEHRQNPDVAYNPVADEYVVAWEQEYQYDPDDYDVYRRRVGSDGTLLEDEIVVSEQFSYEGRPAVASDGDRAYVVVWEDGRSIETQGMDLYGNLVSLPVPTVMTSTAATISTLDSADDVGWFTSITTDEERWGLISYYDFINGDLKVAHCENAACTSATITTPDSAGDVGGFTSITVGADGLGLVSFYDFGNGNLKVAHCEDLDCTEATITTLDNAGNMGLYTSIITGADGLGLISYQSWDDETEDGDLKVAHCEDTACTSATITTLDSEGSVGGLTSMATGPDGLALISFIDSGHGDLKVAHCEDVACTSATITTLDSAGDIGSDTSITVGADGLGLISFIDFANGDLKVAHCEDDACTEATISTLDRAGDVGGFASITTDEGGLGLISYMDFSDGDLKVAHCGNAACTSATITILDSGGYADWFPSTTTGAGGLALISFYDLGSGDLKVAYYQPVAVPTCYDFDRDGQVTVADVQRVGRFWRRSYPGYDLDRDGGVTVADVMKMAAEWGPCPG